MRRRTESRRIGKCMPLWKGRFRKPLAKSALRFSSSIHLDACLFNEDIDGSGAHVRMLMKQKIIPPSDGKNILRALEEIRKEIATGALPIDDSVEDIHTLIEERLVQKIGEQGRRLHTARSRNDQIALDVRLYMRKEIREIMQRIRTLQRAFLDQAMKHRATVVPFYTHLQRAQPILFAHHLLAYVSMLDRDRERFVDCLKRVNRSPLGAAAGAGTSLPIDREFVARQLSFDRVIENSLDAVSDRDALIECIGACALTMMHLSRFAEEMILWSTSEFAFAETDDAYTTGSSLMPQKKNPDLAELIRGKTAGTFGDLIAALTMMKALPLAYNRDMQEDKVHLFRAVATTKESLAIAAELLAHTAFRSDRFESELDGSFALATDLAEYLVRKGTPFRTAHEIVGKIVAQCAERSCALRDLSLKDFKKFSPLFDAKVMTLLQSRESVRAKRSAGSGSPDDVGKQLRAWRMKLKKR